MKDKTLQAGELTVEYAEGKLRNIRFGDTELIRGIYFAVRDAEWGTLPLACQPEQLEFRDGGFTLTFPASSSERGELVVAWNCTIRGDANNRITFAIDGTFVRDYAGNRAGLCLLHPLKQHVGQPFVAQSPQGTRQSGVFPRLISPHQPATDLAGLTWKTANGIACQLTFDGEAFEMEDQRNWTDASFKTYCTPLKKGWPRTYQAGAMVSQTVVFHMLSYEQEAAPDALPVNTVSCDTSIHFPWPGIGSRIPNAPLEDLNARDIAALPLDLLRADVVWGGSDWGNTLTAVIGYAEKCGKPLHLVLHYTEGAMQDLVQALHHHCATAALKAISVVMKDRIATDCEQIQRAHRLMRERFPDVEIGVGTQYLFTEFNRNRPPVQPWADFIFFGNNPQVHAFDNQSIIETIEGQAETVRSARAIAPELPVHISPIALFAPFSPDKLPKSQDTRHEVSYDFAPDPRQGSAFVAGWVLGCLAALTNAGAGRLDFFETEGERGLIVNQKTTPAFDLLDRILGRAPVHLFFSQSSHPLNFSTLGVHTNSGDFLYLASHMANRLGVKADGAWQECARLAPEMDHFTFSCRIENGLIELPPHGIMEITLKADALLKQEPRHQVTVGLKYS